MKTIVVLFFTLAIMAILPKCTKADTPELGIFGAVTDASISKLEPQYGGMYGRIGNAAGVEVFGTLGHTFGLAASMKVDKFRFGVGRFVDRLTKEIDVQGQLVETHADDYGYMTFVQWDISPTWFVRYTRTQNDYDLHASRVVTCGKKQRVLFGESHYNVDANWLWFGVKF